MSYSDVSKHKVNKNDKNLNDFIFMDIPTFVMNKTEKIGDIQYVQDYIAFNPIKKYLLVNKIKCLAKDPYAWDAFSRGK